MSKITRNILIEKVKAISNKLNKSDLSCAAFIRETGIKKYEIYELFPEGGWSEIANIVGLKTGGSGYTLTDDELLKEYHDIVTKLNKIPSWNLFSKHSNISADTIRKRFGGTQGILIKYKNWLEKNKPDSPNLGFLQIKSKHEISPPKSENLEILSIIDTKTKTEWAKKDRTVYGELISFRGMIHAPINELGVVYLFGVVCRELGFIVEAIQSTFPDCEAKRCIDAKNNHWQKVSIEFEYKSSNFKQHFHNSSKCDLIVCWEHDWIECPLEVIELRTIINKLEG